MAIILETPIHVFERKWPSRFYLRDRIARKQIRIDERDASVINMFFVELNSRALTFEQRNGALFFLFALMLDESPRARDLLPRMSPSDIVNQMLSSYEQSLRERDA